ncbi:MAG: cytochrome P450 [Alphaproteobacteria bacterium]|nr:cytochrome P450 [Alphaproteobacteria bacterium]
MIEQPCDPIAAVVHSDPYPFYDRLVTRNPIAFDEALGLWVAAGAEPVRAVLTSELCRVRPVTEPVPVDLLGSAAGEVFAALVRMNDGPRHRALKPAVQQSLGAIDLARTDDLCRHWAESLAAEVKGGGALQAFLFRLPVHVVGALLGLPEQTLRRTADLMADFVRCLAPSSTAAQVERGKAAAGELLDLVRARLYAPVAGSDHLLATLRRAAGEGDLDDLVIAANGLGFLSQAYEATAGLIGNTLVRLGRDPELQSRVEADRGALRGLIAEVSRYDPSIQNTRRFVAEDGVVADRSMLAGDAVLVVLAAANRDPSANPDPDRFDIERADRVSFTFGAGAHACPGENLAFRIAEAGVAALLQAGLLSRRLPDPVRYRASANSRIPLLDDGAEP